MVRNKYPEETKAKILSVAEKLFLEKGYDNTSVQEIIDGLGGLTKGVIYYHFKSKEAILTEILDRQDKQKDGDFAWHGDTALEKLQNLLKETLQNFKKQSLIYSASVALQSPSILSNQYKVAFEVVAPELQKIIEEGKVDGSIQTDYPKEVAELLVLTLNMWLGIQMPNLSSDELMRKLTFLKQTFDAWQLYVFSDDVMAAGVELIHFLKNNEY